MKLPSWLKKAFIRWGRMKPDKKPVPTPGPTPEPTPTPAPTPGPTPTPTPPTQGISILGKFLMLNGARFIPVADCSWLFVRGKLSDTDRLWYMGERKRQGFNTLNLATDGEEYRNKGILDELIRLCRLTWANGFVPIVGIGLHHYENDKPVRHVREGGEREQGIMFGQLLQRFDGPCLVMVNGLDDKISLAHVELMARGFREVNGAPILYHAKHGGYAVPEVTNAIASTQSGHRDLTRASAANLVQRCNPSVHPTIALEPAFEGMPQYGNESHIINASDVRAAIGGAVDAGCAGVGYGHHMVWPFASGWREAVKAAGASIPAQEAKRI
jgi:hypothetical protein